MEWFTNLLASVGALFVFGTIGFWIVTLVFFAWLTMLTERKSHFFATIVFVAFIWTLSSANDVSLFTNPLLWLKWGAIYIGAGAGWSFVKWFALLHRKRDELAGHKDAFVRTHNATLSAEGKIQAQDFAAFLTFLNDHHYQPNDDYGKLRNKGDIIPSVTQRYGDLVRWIVWWPFSAFWTMFDDLLRRIAETVVRSLRNLYTKMAQAVFGSEI